MKTKKIIVRYMTRKDGRAHRNFLIRGDAEWENAPYEKIFTYIGNATYETDMIEPRERSDKK